MSGSSNLEDAFMDVGVRGKHDSREGGGTSSRMSEGRTMQELLSGEAGCQSRACDVAGVLQGCSVYGSKGSNLFRSMVSALFRDSILRSVNGKSLCHSCRTEYMPFGYSRRQFSALVSVIRSRYLLKPKFRVKLFKIQLSRDSNPCTWILY
jgi:hypothetical protein